MRIPFTTPKLPELDSLSDEKRAHALLQYSSSYDARRLINWVRVLFIISVGFLIVAINYGGVSRIASSIAAVLSLVCAIAVYRIGAASALRNIIHRLEN